LLHTNVGDRPGHANYAPCSVEDLRASGMHYWALGHIHQPGRVLDDPPAYYSGIPQGRDPGELGARGCYLVEVDASGGVTPIFLATDVVRWHPLEVSIDGLADADALREACRAAIDLAMADAGGRSLVVRVRLFGRGPLHTSLVRTGYVADLRQLLNEERGVVPPLAWIESIRDATRAEIDLEARRDAPDFVGDFLRTVAAARRSGRTTDPEEFERWQAILGESVHALFEAAPRGRKYLRDVAPDADALVGPLLDEAETLGLDLLVGAEDDR
ncbi:MAG: metallophosphoesterase family protein, partial [Candidatus Limnocylindria bacterium]